MSQIKIKIKEKKKSYSCKLTVPKKYIEDNILTTEDIMYFKYHFLAQISEELDSFILDTIVGNEDNTDLMEIEVHLDRVSVLVTPIELELETEEEELEIEEEEN